MSSGKTIIPIPPKKDYLIYYLVGAVLIGVSMLFFYVRNFGNILSKSTADWGTFGDYVGGGIGTVINLLGVVLIYLTFKAQMEFANASREEQLILFDMQLENSNAQQFEATFFNLLTNQRDIQKGMYGADWDEKTNVLLLNVKVDGYRYLRTVANQLRTLNEDLPYVSDYTALRDLFNKNYEEVYKTRAGQLGHYFRHLYHIVKYVDDSEIANKRKYIDILQAQMSESELYIAFCNGISQYGFTRFLPLMEKYQFLENIGPKPESDNFEEQKKILYPNTFSGG